MSELTRRGFFAMLSASFVAVLMPKRERVTAPAVYGSGFHHISVVQEPLHAYTIGPGPVTRVTVDGKPVPFKVAGDRITFDPPLRFGPGEFARRGYGTTP